MKKLLLIILSTCFLCTGIVYNSYSQCKARQIVKKYKPNMKPYTYDSFAYNKIIFTDKPQKMEVDFTAFAGVKYKLVICTSGFAEQVKVNIYNHSRRYHKRTKLFDNSQGIDNLFWSFAPKKSGTYYIDYDIPAMQAGQDKKGCMLILIGFKQTK